MCHAATQDFSLASMFCQHHDAGYTHTHSHSHNLEAALHNSHCNCVVCNESWVEGSAAERAGKGACTSQGESLNSTQGSE